MTTKHQTQAKKVTGMDTIPYVTNGVASEAEGYVISEDGLTALVEQSIAAEQVPALQQQLAAAQTAQQTAEANLATANDTIAARDARIQELEAQLSESEVQFQEATRQKDDNGKKKVPFHAAAENPFNEVADSLMGKPHKKEEE